MSVRRTIVLVLSVLLFAYCSRTDNVLRAWDAQLRVNAAFQAKLLACEQAQPFLIFVPYDVQEPDVLLCEGEILATPCPVERMPTACFVLLFKTAPNPDIDQKLKITL